MSEERVTLYKKIIRYLLITFSINITYVFYITLQLTFPNLREDFSGLILINNISPTLVVTSQGSSF